MRNIWIITKREIASFFDSLIACVIIVIFLGLSGFFTWSGAVVGVLTDHSFKV